MRIRRREALWLAALLTFCSPTAFTQETSRELDVPYVSTPDVVVQAMLGLANVAKNDVVYDLGCGDGRIVITAAQKFGVRGVGVDIDPQRIRESNENARKAKVDDRLRFAVEDLFVTDLRDASVVMLYLLPEINLKLRPKLLRDLKPGTRVVSHDFTMADWKPDKTQTITSQRAHRLFLWVIPANVTGTWELRASGQTTTIVLEQKFQSVTGVATIDGRRLPLSRVELAGDTLAFTLPSPDPAKKGALRFTGRATGATLKGTVQADNDAASAKTEWAATRTAR